MYDQIWYQLGHFSDVSLPKEKIKDLVVIIIEDASFMATHLTKEGMHPNIILFYSS